MLQVRGMRQQQCDLPPPNTTVSSVEIAPSDHRGCGRPSHWKKNRRAAQAWFIVEASRPGRHAAGSDADPPARQGGLAVDERRKHTHLPDVVRFVCSPKPRMVMSSSIRWRSGLTDPGHCCGLPWGSPFKRNPHDRAILSVRTSAAPNRAACRGSCPIGRSLP